MTKNEISFATKMKLTSLNRVMKPLEQNNMVIKYLMGDSTGGRRPVLYNINLCASYIIGLDIYNNYVKIVFSNLKIDIVCKEVFKIEYKDNPDKITRKILETIDKMVLNLSFDYLSLIGIGISVVDATDLKSISIKNILQKKLDCPVILENRAISSVVLEYFYKFNCAFKNIGYFNCESKITTGIILSGKILRTFNSGQDAFENMIVDINECLHSSNGCIQTYSSTDALVKRFIARISKGGTTIINKSLSNIDYKDICIAAEQNDDLSISIIKEAAIAFGIGLINYIQLLDLKVVILTGDLPKNSKMFYDICIKMVSEKLHLDKGTKVIFKKKEYFAEDTAAIGAAAVIMEKYLDNYN
ncbi:ROK family protein [Clostridium tyrobutyricum]|uniref:ROK family protein n=1 Tax=Clostridium tyrobutyricum TaxID=1519 RepID=UPI0018ABF29E|nr:ROK family protein [Clostridium tyrobutyricum]MBR9649429.1 ROK family protein [Clostridium tyrobutyricum]